jgi:hypothetical protein
MEETLFHGGSMNIQATSGNTGSSLKSIVTSAAQEALETARVTKAEAITGDQQAIRKLAKEQLQNPAPTPVSPEGTGKALNLMA